MSRDPQEELTNFLSDMYSVEQQALAQLVSAPDMAGDPAFAADLRKHEGETEEQARLVGGRLEARGGKPSMIKDTIMRLGGKGFLLFAKAMPETPGRLLAHCYSYEAMEFAGYEMLKLLAEAVGDAPTAEVAARIGAEEKEMMNRLGDHYEGVENASHAKTPTDELVKHVQSHLAEAHALEAQTMTLLEKGEKIAGVEELRICCRKYAGLSKNRGVAIETELASLGADPSVLEDSALSAGGYNWGLFFQAQADTPVKLAAFVFAVGHLKVAGYELLARTAERSGTESVRSLCEGILEEERMMLKTLLGTFPLISGKTLSGLKP